MARDAVLAGRETRPSLPKPATIVGYACLAAESGRDIEAVVHEANPRLGDRIAELRAIAEGYGERKRAMGAVDYADLLTLTVGLLEEHPSVRARLQERYRWVLVDELHDVNPVQARFMELIAGDAGNLIAVADPDQAVYSWRGADPEVVSRFAAVPGTRVFPLQTNYRSTPEVVALAQRTLPAGNPFGSGCGRSGRPPASGRWWRICSRPRRRRGSSRSGSPTSSPPDARPARSPCCTGRTTTRSSCSSPSPRRAWSSSSTPARGSWRART